MVEDERGRRKGRNENVFREINERLKELNEAFSLVSEQGEFVCECGRLSCDDRISLTIEEYEAVRRDPARFVLKLGHEEPDVEEVLEVTDRYTVVRKRAGEP